MKRILSMTLTAALVLSALPHPVQAETGPSWSKVEAVHTGSRLFVAIDGPVAEHQTLFVAADDTTLTLLDPIGASLPPEAARFVMDVLHRHPEQLTATTGEFIADGFRLTPDALFYRGARIASRADFVRTIDKERIVEVIRPAKGANVAAVAGAVAGGIVLGMMLGVGVLFTPCHGGCAGNGITAVALMAGVPLATGFLTAQATRHTPETLYHA